MSLTWSGFGLNWTSSWFTEWDITLLEGSFTLPRWYPHKKSPKVARIRVALEVDVDDKNDSDNSSSDQAGTPNSANEIDSEGNVQGDAPSVAQNNRSMSRRTTHSLNNIKSKAIMKVKPRRNGRWEIVS